MAAQDSNDGQINSPQIDPKTLAPVTRAVRDAEQAGKLAKQLQHENNERSIKNGRIMAKYNAEKPFATAELESEGLGWKSNFSTKPLAVLIDKVSPRFTSAIQKARYLTSARLPDRVPGAAKKSEYFQQEITRTIRARPGWKNLIGEMAQENALFGYGVVGWVDEYTWFPKFYRQDRVFFPTGTKQDIESCQVLVLRDSMLPHQLFQKVVDAGPARMAGWNVENTVAAINDAMPENMRSGQSDWSRVYEDLVRQSSMVSSLSTGAKVVDIFHVLVREVTGTVSHFMVEGREYKEIFRRFDRFTSMADCGTFFSFQQGNGTMHGSKGIGREIYAMAGVLDRARNEVVDRLQLSGKLVLTCDEKMIKRFRMSVIGSAILIGGAYTIQKQSIEANVEPFFQLDTYLTSILDQIAGATSPKQLEGERVTKAQVDLYASREEEKRDSIIERFLTQLADCITSMTRRLVNPQTIEADAKDLQARLLELLTPEEIQHLAAQPAVGTVADFTELERQQLVFVCDQAKGNPLYNQRETEYRKLSATVGPETAEALLLPEEDPTIVAEQSRLQQMENSLLLTGQTVPVSPRDNPMVHLQELMPVIEQAIKQSIQDPNADLLLQKLVEHADSHLKIAQSLGMKPEQFADVLPVIEGAKKALQQLAALAQQTQQPPTNVVPLTS